MKSVFEMSAQEVQSRYLLNVCQFYNKFRTVPAKYDDHFLRNLPKFATLGVMLEMKANH